MSDSNPQEWANQVKTRAPPYCRHDGIPVNGGSSDRAHRIAAGRLYSAVQFVVELIA